MENVPVMNRQNDLFQLQRFLYDYYSLETNSEGEVVAAKVLSLLTEDGKGFGEVLEGVLSSSVVLDMLRKDGIPKCIG